MKKILMYRWEAYNYLDIKKHFEIMGYEVDEIYQHLDSYDVAPEFSEILTEKISSTTYEFVFTVNYFAVIANVCRHMGIIYVSWSCDNPLISMYHESVFYDTNRIFLFDYINYHEFKQMGVEHVYYLPLCANPDRTDSVIANAKDLDDYKNLISFVGSLYERNTYDRIESQLPEYLRGYLEGCMEIQSNIFGKNYIDIALTPEILATVNEYFVLDKSEESFSDLGLVFSTTTLGFKAAAITRINALNYLANSHDVSIYSNSDTECLPRVRHMGSLDYWGELPKVFYKSSINLNFTIPNIRSGIPLRVWDIMGSKGFMLTSFQPEMELFFKEGEDIATFKSLDELYEKTEYYLEHEAAREMIIKNAYEKIKKYHTYMVRLDDILKAVYQISGGDL